MARNERPPLVNVWPSGSVMGNLVMVGEGDGLKIQATAAARATKRTAEIAHGSQRRAGRRPAPLGAGVASAGASTGPSSTIRASPIACNRRFGSLFKHRLINRRITGGVDTGKRSSF